MKIRTYFCCLIQAFFLLRKTTLNVVVTKIIFACYSCILLVLLAAPSPGSVTIVQETDEGPDHHRARPLRTVRDDIEDRLCFCLLLKCAPFRPVIFDKLWNRRFSRYSTVILLWGCACIPPLNFKKILHEKVKKDILMNLLAEQVQ